MNDKGSGQAGLALRFSREAWELAADMPAGLWRREHRAGTSDLGGCVNGGWVGPVDNFREQKRQEGGRADPLDGSFSP